MCSYCKSYSDEHKKGCPENDGSLEEFNRGFSDGRISVDARPKKGLENSYYLGYRQGLSSLG